MKSRTVGRGLMMMFPPGTWPWTLNLEEILSECRLHSLMAKLGYAQSLMIIVR